MDNLYNYFRKFSDKVYFLTVKNIEINEKIMKISIFQLVQMFY